LCNGTFVFLFETEIQPLFPSKPQPLEFTQENQAFFTYLLCCSSFYRSIAKNLPATLYFAAPLPHSHPTSNNIHNNIQNPNKRKRHKDFNAINTTTSPLMFFPISMPL
jgi:hypothetical protein